VFWFHFIAKEMSMPRLVDVAAGRATLQSYSFSAQAPAASTATPKRALRRFVIPKLTAAERREFLDAFGPVLSLEKAAEIAGLSPRTLKKQLSQGKYADCVKRKKSIRFITDRFIQELFGGARQ
jgi:hypothetical protein